MPADPNSIALTSDNKIQFRTLNCVATALSILNELSDEERVEVFGNFCMHCGDNDPHCQCWNDE